MLRTLAAGGGRCRVGAAWGPGAGEGGAGAVAAASANRSVRAGRAVRCGPALTQLYRVFQAHAPQTEHVDEWQNTGNERCGPEPLVPVFAWGQLSERRGIVSYRDEDDEESPDDFARVRRFGFFNS